MLTPLAVGPGQPFPYISGLSLSLGHARARSGDGRGAVRAGQGPRDAAALRARSATGACCSRSRSVIGHFLPWLFPGMEIGEQAVFRVTRDADFEVSDEADDLLEAVELEVRRRRFGEVVRLEVSSSISRGHARAAHGGPGRRRRPGLPDRRHARPRRPHGDRDARPARSCGTSPGCRTTQPRLGAAQRSARPLRGDPQRATSSCTSPTTRSRRASRRSCAAPSRIRT